MPLWAGVIFFLVWADAELVSDSPAKVNQPADKSVSQPGRRLSDLTDNARHEFTLFTSCFVPLDDGVEWLGSMVKRGIAVHIVTNSLSSSDMLPAQAGYENYRLALVKGGVDLYEIKALKQ